MDDFQLQSDIESGDAFVTRHFFNVKQFVHSRSVGVTREAFFFDCRLRQHKSFRVWGGVNSGEVFRPIRLGVCIGGYQ